MNTTITDKMLGVFLQYVGTQLASGNYASMRDVFVYADSPQAVKPIRTFFLEHGIDGACINTRTIHLMVRQLYFPNPKPLRTFAEIQECLVQYEQDLVSQGELLLACQLTPHQVDAVIAYNRLPYKVQSKHALSDWDEDVALRTERGDLTGQR
jgi:hypothetical protein